MARIPRTARHRPPLVAPNLGVENHPLARATHGAFAPQLGSSPDQIVNEVVGVIGVVVDQDEVPCVGEIGELHCVRDAAVAPAHPLAVLLVGVLPVVEENIDSLSQIEA